MAKGRAKGYKCSEETKAKMKGNVGTHETREHRSKRTLAFYAAQRAWLATMPKLPKMPKFTFEGYEEPTET